MQSHALSPSVSASATSTPPSATAALLHHHRDPDDDDDHDVLAASLPAPSSYPAGAPSSYPASRSLSTRLRAAVLHLRLAATSFAARKRVFQRPLALAGTMVLGLVFMALLVYSLGGRSPARTTDNYTAALAAAAAATGPAATGAAARRANAFPGSPLAQYLGRERGNLERVTSNRAPRLWPLPASPGLLAAAVAPSAQERFIPVLERFRNEGFSAILFDFNGTVDWSHVPAAAGVPVVRAVGQTKMWFAKRYLTPAVVDNYEYIFLWDDDVGLDDDWSPRLFTDVMRRFGVHVAQPSLKEGARDWYPQFPVVRWHSGASIDVPGRMTDFCELMFPVVTRAAWQGCYWEAIPFDGFSYWGVDNVVYPHCASAGFCRFAVIDLYPVSHLDTRTLQQNADSNIDELLAYFAHYTAMCDEIRNTQADTDASSRTAATGTTADGEPVPPAHKPLKYDPATTKRLAAICAYIDAYPLGHTFRTLAVMNAMRHSHTTCPEADFWPGIPYDPEKDGASGSGSGAMASSF
ncbi:hypothetical protein H9P43_008306 [Blastocladiella emersonii ATCC 22665]|nr:hypothetical protein H9P43_008306 [Blastocladiella emersonii ATCC 22665]